ncbi:MAG: hypothetical protein KAS23_14160 [Anaerohalosphaera sp.]|nr:hypothetical protein [Anaerohalosphaera sp.]
MRRMVGYMLTWTTYGSWLQGDERGYVATGVVLGDNESLKRHNQQEMAGEEVCLSEIQRCIVGKAITAEASNLNKKVYAMTVGSRHAHVVLDWDMHEIGTIAGKLKRAATVALREASVEGKVWTKGYDVRYCYDIDALHSRIEYVEKHGSKEM